MQSYKHHRRGCQRWMQNRDPVTLTTYWREEELPDTAEPAVELSLPGGQLMDSRDKTHNVLVCQHCQALAATAHVANVTRLQTFSHNRDICFVTFLIFLTHTHHQFIVVHVVRLVLEHSFMLTKLSNSEQCHTNL